MSGRIFQPPVRGPSWPTRRQLHIYIDGQVCSVEHTVAIKMLGYRSSLVAQQVKDMALLLQRLGSLLWCKFDP